MAIIHPAFSVKVIAFVSDDEMAKFNEDYKNNKVRGLYNPALGVVNRGDVYKFSGDSICPLGTGLGGSMPVEDFISEQTGIEFSLE